MKVFVTGASGFIGGQLVDRLMKKGGMAQGMFTPVEIICLASRPEVLRQRWGTQIHIVEGRLDSLARHRDVLQSCAYVFHLAAEASLRNGSSYVVSNSEGTRHLLDALKGSTVLRRLVFTSTIGAVDRAPDDPCARPLDESSPRHPLSEYGRTKKVCEEMMAAETSLPWTIIRPTWVYGPGMREASHLRVLMRMVLSGNPLSRIHFPGRVSLIHVEDMVDALLLVARDDRAIGQTYFASDGRSVALGELFRELGELSGNTGAGRIGCAALVTATMRAVRRWLPLTAQNLFSDVLCANSGKLVALGFVPAVPRERGLVQTLRWHREQGRTPCAERAISVITGAAGGLGSALARQLYVAGHRLLLVDRDAVKLAALAQELSAHYLVLDLSQPADLAQIETYIMENRLTVNWLVNNAGIGVRGAVDAVSFERQKLAIDVNCVALTYLSQLGIREFRKSGSGVLVNIASSSAFQPLPYMAAYAASKAYALHFSRAITGEVMDVPGIHVLTVNPAGIDTGFQSAAGVKKNPRERLLSPWYVSEQICRAVEASRNEIAIGLPSIGMAIVARLLPVSVQVRLWRRLMSKLR